MYMYMNCYQYMYVQTCTYIYICPVPAGSIAPWRLLVNQKKKNPLIKPATACKCVTVCCNMLHCIYHTRKRAPAAHTLWHLLHYKNQDCNVSHTYINADAKICIYTHERQCIYIYIDKYIHGRNR